MTKVLIFFSFYANFQFFLRNGTSEYLICYFSLCFSFFAMLICKKNKPTDQIVCRLRFSRLLKLFLSTTDEV